MPIITISRQTASMGNKIAKELSMKLGFELISREYVVNNWLTEVADKHELHMLKESSKSYMNKIKGLDITYAQYLEEKLKKIAQNQSLIILGLGSQIIFAHDPQALHIKIVASQTSRKERLAKKYGLSLKQANQSLQLSDRKHSRYIWRIYEMDWSQLTLYHLCINTDGISVNKAVDLIIYLLELKKEDQLPLVSKKKEEIISEIKAIKEPDFAHPSEKEFANILDMHNIKWEYEPTEFPLEWDAEGNIIFGFRPDFYLVEHDIYIELTTRQQKYVTEKNKKMRLLKKLYPDVNIRIVYKKDFNSLISRFSVKKRKEES